METTTENQQLPNEEKIKFPWQGFLVLVAVVAVLIVGASYIGSCRTKHSLESYAREQLISQNYTVLELTVLDYHTANKMRNESGKVSFKVKDIHGAIFTGIAEISNKSHWLIFNKQVFTITEIKPQK